MKQPHEDLFAGSPVFADADIALHAAAEDAGSAWRRAFERVGVKALDTVSGPFAVGIRLQDGRTLLAVDRFGIQPLCYRVVGGQLHFAQRADQLADRSTPIDPQALFDYLYFHVIPSPRTVFQGVQRLPPGHVALFDRGAVTVEPYWVPRFQVAVNADFRALRGEFLGLLHDAVKAQLDGNKAGCFLSGGTDSSTVAGMIGLASGTPASTYSIGFEAEGYDEMAYARIAAKHFGTDHHEYYVTPDDLVRSISAVAGHYDQPFGNSSALPAFYCATMARDDGVTRILAGDGGDELFGGNTRYARQRILGWYGHVPGPLRRVLEPVFGHAIMAGTLGIGKVSSYIKQAAVQMPDQLHAYNQLKRIGYREVLTPTLLALADTQGPTTHQRDVWGKAHAKSKLDRQLAFDWRYTLAETDLPKVCGTAMLAGIDVGFPILDQRVIDFSMRLPASYKLKGLKLRWFFKEALRGFLPDEILAKKKQGFGLPFGVWATRHAGLNRLAQDSLGSLSTREIVRPEFIKSLLHQRLAEHPGHYGEMVWILMMLEQWLQRHAPDYKAKS